MAPWTRLQEIVTMRSSRLSLSCDWCLKVSLPARSNSLLLHDTLLFTGYTCVCQELPSWTFTFLFTVNAECPSSGGTDDQCYTVSFSRSVFEGHDNTVTRDSSKTHLLVTVYSNNELTNRLKGYMIGTNFNCAGIANITVQLSGKDKPGRCDAILVSSRCWLW